MSNIGMGVNSSLISLIQYMQTYFCEKGAKTVIAEQKNVMYNRCPQLLSFD
jgi:hypothetical protein